MTKITKYLRSVEELKKELEEQPENIKHYMGYMGYEAEDEGSLDYIKEKKFEYFVSLPYNGIVDVGKYAGNYFLNNDDQSIYRGFEFERPEKQIELNFDQLAEK